MSDNFNFKQKITFKVENQPFQVPWSTSPSVFGYFRPDYFQYFQRDSGFGRKKNIWELVYRNYNSVCKTYIVENKVNLPTVDLIQKCNTTSDVWSSVPCRLRN